MPPDRRFLLLLDRDGTLMEDVGYPDDPARVRLIPGAAEAVRALVGCGAVPAVVSNQSGIARGLIAPERAAAVHERFVELFAEALGGRLPCFYCPHGPDDGCACRKPRPGLLERAAREVGIVGPAAVMVGDKPADVAAGAAFGAATVWLSHGRPYPAGETVPDLIADGWADLPLLVPKLCLGTHVREAPLRAVPARQKRSRIAGKQSFPALRSQAELGNEEEK